MRWFPLAVIATVVAAECYYPDGSTGVKGINAYNWTPCGGVNTTYNQCCIAGEDACLPNGMCSFIGRYDYRAACSDKDWSGCQLVCPEIQNASWVQVKQCASGQYCCNADLDHGDCCRDGSERFNMEAPKPSITAAPPTTTASTQTTRVSSSTTNPVVIVTATIEPTETAASDPQPKKGENHVGAAVGGALGGVAILGGLIFLFWFFRNLKKKGPSPPDSEKWPYFFPAGKALSLSSSSTSSSSPHIYSPSSSIHSPSFNPSNQTTLSSPPSAYMYNSGHSISPSVESQTSPTTNHYLQSPLPREEARLQGPFSEYYEPQDPSQIYNPQVPPSPAFSFMSGATLAAMAPSRSNSKVRGPYNPQLDGLQESDMREVFQAISAHP